MELKGYGPLLSGLAGAAITAWLTVSWARFVPKSSGDRDADELRSDYRIAIRTSRALFYSSLALLLWVYISRRVNPHAWGAFALIMGFGMTAAVMVLAVSAHTKGRPISEALTVFAIDQKVPIPVACVLIALGALGLIAGIIAFL